MYIECIFDMLSVYAYESVKQGRNTKFKKKKIMLQVTKYKSNIRKKKNIYIYI